MIRRLGDDYHVSSLYRTNYAVWLDLIVERQANCLPHMNPGIAFETWYQADSHSKSFLRDLSERPEQPPPLRRWHHIKETLSHLAVRPLFDLAKAKQHFRRQNHPIYPRITNTNVDTCHAVSNAAQVRIKANVSPRLDTAGEKTGNLSPESASAVYKIPAMENDDTTGSSDQAYPISDQRVSLADSLEDIMAHFEFDINNDGRFPPKTESFFMTQLSIMEKNHEAWQSIDDSIRERYGDKDLSILTQIQRYNRLRDVRNFCTRHNCKWCPERLEQLPKFVRFELRGVFHVQYECARRHGQPEPRGLTTWLPFPFPGSWF